MRDWGTNDVSGRPHKDRNPNVCEGFTAYNLVTRLNYDPGSGAASYFKSTTVENRPAVGSRSWSVNICSLSTLTRPHANRSSFPPQLCPVCRSEVDRVQHVYLPTCTSLLNLTLTDNHQHRTAIPATIHRDLAQPHTEYEPKIYHT